MGPGQDPNSILGPKALPSTAQVRASPALESHRQCPTPLPQLPALRLHLRFQSPISPGCTRGPGQTGMNTRAGESWTNSAQPHPPLSWGAAPRARLRAAGAESGLPPTRAPAAGPGGGCRRGQAQRPGGTGPAGQHKGGIHAGKGLLASPSSPTLGHSSHSHWAPRGTPVTGPGGAGVTQTRPPPPGREGGHV